jgi:FixJ family two-component response regulator
MKTREIAHQLNISPLTVKKHIAQAVRSIRHLLEKQTGLTGVLLIGLFNLMQNLFD